MKTVTIPFNCQVYINKKPYKILNNTFSLGTITVSSKRTPQFFMLIYASFQLLLIAIKSLYDKER